jgi:Tfp pilus assembly protein PilV
LARSFIRRLGDASGYSLVEVTVAMVVLVLAVIPLVGVLEAGLRAATAGGRYDGARALAGEKVEAVRALPYDNAVERYAPPGPPGGAEGPYAYAVETEFVDAGLGPADSPTGQMRIDVTVTWDGGSYAATGLVSGEPP